jgi:hypothetical protein
VTLFRGNNEHDRAKQAHSRWIEEEGRNLPPGTRPTREVATRLSRWLRVSNAVQGAHMHGSGRKGAEPPVR